MVLIEEMVGLGEGVGGGSLVQTTLQVLRALAL